MRLTALFLLLCTLSCFFFLKDDSFLNESYIKDDIVVGYNYSKNEPVSYNLLSYPLDSYISDNSQDIASFSDSVQDVFWDLEDLASDLYDTGKGFFDKISTIDVDLSGDPLSAAYLYNNDRAYYTFVRTYLRTLESYYRKADFNIIQKYFIPRYVTFMPALTEVLQTNTKYYNGMNPVSGSSFSTWGGNYFIVDPYYYFDAFGVSPEWHISIQDNFCRWGINSLYIDKSFLVQGVYNIFIRRYSRSLDSEGSLVVTLLENVFSGYVYDPVSKTVYERG